MVIQMKCRQSDKFTIYVYFYDLHYAQFNVSFVFTKCNLQKEWSGFACCSISIPLPKSWHSLDIWLNKVTTMNKLTLHKDILTRYYCLTRKLNKSDFIEIISFIHKITETLKCILNICIRAFVCCDNGFLQYNKLTKNHFVHLKT